MSLINVQEIQTVWGYKSVELHHADITNLNFNVDCILVSAASGGYFPLPGTVLSNLKINCNICLYDYVDSAEIKLSHPFNIWITKEINSHNFKRIACIEILGTSYEIDKLFRNIVSLLQICETNEIEIKSIALPLLGTGSQGLNPNIVLPALLEQTIRALKYVNQLNKIVFVEKDETKIKTLDAAMNTFLQRNEISTGKIPQSLISKLIIEELNNNLSKIENKIEGNATVRELILKLNAEQTRVFELAILGTRLVEFIVRDILMDFTTKEELWKFIDRLKGKKIAPWIISYMHIVRTFGNIVAHESTSENSFPSTITDNDFINFLFCLNRLSDFWLQFDNYRVNQ